MTWFHKIGRISANNGPILKIRNLAYSVLRCRPSGRYNDVARDIIRARTSLWTSQISEEPQSESGCRTRCYGPISETAGWIFLKFCTQICIDWPITCTQNHYDQANIC